MKNFLLSLLMISLQHLVYAQPGMWTWMKGESIDNSPGYYGSIGVTSPLNNPPGLYGTGTWRDLQGNLWLFGGSDLNSYMYNGLWKFDPLINNWTWVHGSSTINQPGIYGTKAVPSPLNHPGARGYGFLTWTDLNGDLWLYSGYGIDQFGLEGRLSDLWKYSIPNNEWTWMFGDSSINGLASLTAYQTFSPLNKPGHKQETTACWTDDSGNLWLFGGGDGIVISDLVWQYSPSLNQWAWMKGNGSYTPADFGVQGVYSSSNTPGSRWAYNAWKDVSGKFWLFGGTANIYFGPHYADLWSYDPVINNWAWISGSNNPYSGGAAGDFCEEDISYFPRARFENRAGAIDPLGNLILFGGENYHFPDSLLNDLWSYNPSDNKWKLIYGTLLPNQSNNYGTLGITLPTNQPSGRAGAVSWADNEGNFWLYGGFEYDNATLYGTKNDLWKFGLPACTPYFASSNNTLCEKFCIDYFDQSANNPTAWAWQFPGGIPSSSIAQNPTNICYNNPGTYDVTLITTNSLGTDTITLPGFITVYPTPPFPTITQNGNMLTSSPAASYQWQFNSFDIAGATSQSYTITQTGFYTVVVGDSNGCKNLATIYVEITGIENLFPDLHISIYPNPSDGNFIIEFAGTGFQAGAEVKIEIHNVMGQIVFSGAEKITSDHFTSGIDLSLLSSGLYLLDMSLKTSADDVAAIITKKKLIISK